jgi:hypothetical protein
MSAAAVQHRAVVGWLAIWLAIAARIAGADTTPPTKDVVAQFAEAGAQHRVGIARKTKPVDARPARPGEVVVTVIKGEGVETRSKPAEAGDWVVRNRCPATGNERYLVKATKFPSRYGEPQGPADPEGWREFHPKGTDMRYFILTGAGGAFSFTAPWGEATVAKPGDAIVQTPGDEKDTYRVAAESFVCTYEVVPHP